MALIVAASAYASAQAGDPGLAIVGRWMDTGAWVHPASGARFSGLDIVVCGDRACGIVLNADGSCGSVALRIVFRNAREGARGNPSFIRYVGTMEQDGKVANAFAQLIDSKPPAFVFRAYPKGVAETAPLEQAVYAGQYKRAGAVSCAPPVN